MQWRCNDGSYFTPSVSAAELDELAAIPRLRALDARPRWSAGPAHLESLSQRAGLSGLITLSCAMQQLDQSALQSLAQNCPRLATLCLGGARRPAKTFPPVHILPALTDLTIADQVHVARENTLIRIFLCAGLRRLALLAEVSANVVHAILVSPNLHSLEQLTVADSGSRSPPEHNQLAAQLDAALVNLPSLQSLRLLDFFVVDPVLWGLTRCPALRSLHIRIPWRPAPAGLRGLPGTSGPSAGSLDGLLIPNPALRVVLSLPTFERWMEALRPAATLREFHADSWRSVRGSQRARAAASTADHAATRVGGRRSQHRHCKRPRSTTR